MYFAIGYALNHAGHMNEGVTYKLIMASDVQDLELGWAEISRELYVLEKNIIAERLSRGKEKWETHPLEWNGCGPQILYMYCS